MSATTKPYTGGWFDKRNKRRKEEYAKDADYRAKQQEMSRSTYRAKRDVKLADPRDNLPIIHTFGSMVGNELLFTVSQLSKALNKSPKQVRQWITDGRLPEPRDAGFYTRPEVDAIIQAIGPTLSEFAYFRTDHVDAIAAVHEAVRALRA
jgi:hypothetical protein